MTSLYVFRSTISVRCARRTVLIIHNAAVSVASKTQPLFFRKTNHFFLDFLRGEKYGGLSFATAHIAKVIPITYLQ